MRICLITLALVWRVGGFKPFDDSVLFKLAWSSGGAPEELLRKYKENALNADEAVVVNSVDLEKYICSIPQPYIEESSAKKEYFGQTPRQLLQPLYQLRSCTYRIEMYWTYELCHGRYLLQYHEEKDVTRKISRQEYYLGQYMADSVAADEEKFDPMNPPNRKVEDQLLPYYPVRYIQGTVCDITKKPRVTTVQYVCVEGSKNQIYSFEEVSSCEYEIVVLTPRLCSHPAFKMEEKKELDVACYPLDGSPSQPTALTVWEEREKWEARQQHRKILFQNKESFRQSREREKREKEDKEEQDRYRREDPSAPPTTDQSLVDSFLSGDYCLYGGSGWWKHEYCHGKQVIQFHEDPKSGRIDILLGAWKEDVHLKWISDRPHKRPLRVDGKIRQVSHYYSGGDVCDLTNQPRTVEVRLRCREAKGNSNAVTLYLLEPKSCEYILGVESEMFCALLQTADENGMLKKKEP